MEDMTVVEEMYRALRLVQVLQVKPGCNCPGFGVNLDPMARKQLDAAISRCHTEYPDLLRKYPNSA